MDIQVICGTCTYENITKQPQTSVMLRGPRAKRTVFPSALPFINRIWDCIYSYQPSDKMVVCWLPGFKKPGLLLLWPQWLPQGCGVCTDCSVPALQPICLGKLEQNVMFWWWGDQKLAVVAAEPSFSSGLCLLPQLCSGIPSGCDSVRILPWSLKTGNGSCPMCG